MDYVLVLILGLVIGSFLNVCIYRIPKEESIAFPPSHCMKCGYRLKWYDLVPVISYITLKGRCRKCKDKISIQYPIVEIANGLIYLSIYYKYGITLSCIQFMFLSSLILVIGFIDFKTKFVYTNTVIVGVAVDVIFILISWYTSKTFPIDNIAGGILAFLIIWIIVVITRGMGMGEGDAEIALVSGLLLGIKGASFMLFCSIILGGIVSGFILLLKLKDRKSEIAFGPFMAVGTLISILFGDMVVSYYLSTILIL